MATSAWLLTFALVTMSSEQDPFLWLEDVEGTKALDWVRSQNERSLERLEADSRYAEFKSVAEEIAQSKDRIPYVSIRGKHVYNFWQDATHVRGLWRRTLLKNYVSSTATNWETVLDFDALAEAEKENWVYKGAECLPPDYSKCLVKLSRGGKDATVVREFDISTRTFVKDGFNLPEAKSRVSWVGPNTVLVGTDFGKGSLTESGYPRIIKVWQRGRPLSSAKTMLEGKPKDVASWAYRAFRSDGDVTLFGRSITFWESQIFVCRPSDGALIEVPVPRDAEYVNVFQGRLLFTLRSPWKQGGKQFPAGALVAVPIKPLLGKTPSVSAEAVYTPGESSAVQSVSVSNEHLYLGLIENVRGKVLRISAPTHSSPWKTVSVELPAFGNIGVAATSAYSDHAFFSYEGFLSPEQLYYTSGPKSTPRSVKSLPERFDSSKYEVHQKFAKSRDGTSVPYFLIHSKKLEKTGDNPTLLYGYGGFEIPLLPWYSGVVGNLWLERGGVYVVGNIRGGGELGPKWHQAALKENRQRAFDDFIAIAQDLVGKKITSAENLGIMGGSNGGLLVGSVFTQRPELFGAVVCQVPLLDMLRFDKLLAGASWVGEYGDPDDPEMRPILEGYSPYHNVMPNKRYPEVFFLTSTKDDRVHPGHARKMVARMKQQKHPVLYYENIEGGHGAAANQRQKARRWALEYVYLHQKLSD